MFPGLPVCCFPASCFLGVCSSFGTVPKCPKAFSGGRGTPRGASQMCSYQMQTPKPTETLSGINCSYPKQPGCLRPRASVRAILLCGALFPGERAQPWPQLCGLRLQPSPTSPPGLHQFPPWGRPGPRLPLPCPPSVL